jgi:hypothetical protein
MRVALYHTTYVVREEGSTAAYYETGYGLAELDLEMALKTGNSVVPHEQLLQVARRYGTVRNVKNATRAQEFLLKGGIDSRAVLRQLQAALEGRPCCTTKRSARFSFMRDMR